MKKVILSLAFLFIINSTAMAARQLSDFPLGMSRAEAISKGLVMRDQHGGLADVIFGGKEWPAALVFEDEKLIYLILNGSGDEYLSAADDGLWQLGWLVIYAATDNNLTFDAVKLAASGMDEIAIGEEYENFQQIVQSQNFKDSVSVYVSERVWIAFRELRGENPVDKYPDATICNVTVNKNEATLVFSTFGYMNKIRQNP